MVVARKSGTMRTRKKAENGRKQKREYGGSIRQRNGKIYARIQYFGEDGKRRDKEREVRHRKHARELITEMRAELGNDVFGTCLPFTRNRNLCLPLSWTEGRLPGSGHTQFVTFAHYVNVNEQAARKGAARLAEYIGQSGTSQSQELVH